MKRTSGTYAKTYRRDLAALHVDTGRPLVSGGRDADTAEHMDDRLLERLDNPAHPDARTMQVEEQIGDKLSRPMIGYLPASIGTNDGNRSGVSHVAASSGLSECEDRGMFEQPELVGRVDTSRLRTQSHRLHCRAVRYASEPADKKRSRL